jgi:hypothetical protein
MMGFGLMGAGAAVSGLMGGYQQGRKFAQDEERFGMEKERFGLEKEEAGQRKRLRDEQITGAVLLNKKAQREIRLGEEEDEDIRESINIVKETYAPKQAPAGAADPTSNSAPSQVPVTMTAADGSEVQMPQGGGIAPPPGAARVAAPQAGPSLNDIQGMYNRLNQRGLSRILRTQGPAAAVQQALEMGKRFGDAKTDAAISALSGFTGGNADQVSAALTQSGLPMPEGTKYERREIEVIPGSGYKVNDVVAISPDGKPSVSLHQLMRSRMTPAEIMRQDTDIGKAVADISLRKTAEQNLQEYRTQDLAIKEESAAVQANYYLKMLDAKNKELGFQSQARADANEAQAELRRSQASRNALGEIMQLSGVSRETSAKDMEMLSDTERVRVQSGLSKSFTAHTIWSMNRGNLSPAEALEIGRRVAMDPKTVKVDDGGQAFIQFNGKSVFVPTPVRPAAPAPAPGAPGAPAAPLRDNRPAPASVEAGDRRAMTDTVKNVGAAAYDVATVIPRGLMGAAETGITRPLRAAGIPVPYLPESAYGGDRTSVTPMMDKLRRERQEGR